MAKKESNPESMLSKRLGARRWSRTDAEQVLLSWFNSGLSVGDFARKHDLQVQRLTRWKKKVGAGLLHQREVPTEPESTAEDPVARFVPAIIAGEPANTAPVVVRLPGELTVEVNDTAAVPAWWIAQVLSELAGAAS